MKDFFKFAKISELCGGESAAVFGAGTSGKAAKALLEKAGMEVVVYDKNGGGSCEKIFDESSAKKHRLAVYSPAFRPDHEWVQLAEKAGEEREEMFRHRDAIYAAELSRLSGEPVCSQSEVDACVEELFDAAES